jgi:hypothetical protein
MMWPFNVSRAATFALMPEAIEASAESWLRVSSESVATPDSIAFKRSAATELSGNKLTLRLPKATTRVSI